MTEKQIIRKKRVVELKAVDLIKPIETGMNPATDNEKSKKKIVSGINPFYK